MRNRLLCRGIRAKGPSRGEARILPAVIELDSQILPRLLPEPPTGMRLQGTTNPPRDLPSIPLAGVTSLAQRDLGRGLPGAQHRRHPRLGTGPSVTTGYDRRYRRFVGNSCLSQAINAASQEPIS